MKELYIENGILSICITKHIDPDASSHIHVYYPFKLSLVLVLVYARWHGMVW